MQIQTEPSPPVNEPDSSIDHRELLLEEVNFKWLMAGIGWWVDMSRFHSDARYAAHYLALAAQSESPELRKFATLLSGKSPTKEKDNSPEAKSIETMHAQSNEAPRRIT